jgi:hypothetical protein
VGTGFGDAVIVAADDAGLADATFATGFSERLHAAKKNSGMRMAMFRINRCIKNLLFEFLELLNFIKSYISKAVKSQPAFTHSSLDTKRTSLKALRGNTRAGKQTSCCALQRRELN